MPDHFRAYAAHGRAARRVWLRVLSVSCLAFMTTGALGYGAYQSAQAIEVAPSLSFQGSLTPLDDPIVVDLPRKVAFGTFLVEQGDLVAAGDALAEYDRAWLEARRDEIDAQIQEVRDDLACLRSGPVGILIKRASAETELGRANPVHEHRSHDSTSDAPLSGSAGTGLSGCAQDAHHIEADLREFGAVAADLAEQQRLLSLRLAALLRPLLDASQTDPDPTPLSLEAELLMLGARAEVPPVATPKTEPSGLNHRDVGVIFDLVSAHGRMSGAMSDLEHSRAHFVAQLASDAMAREKQLRRSLSLLLAALAAVEELASDPYVYANEPGRVSRVRRVASGRVLPGGTELLELLPQDDRAFEIGFRVAPAQRATVTAGAQARVRLHGLSRRNEWLDGRIVFAEADDPNASTDGLIYVELDPASEARLRDLVDEIAFAGTQTQSSVEVRTHTESLAGFLASGTRQTLAKPLLASPERGRAMVDLNT